MPIKLSQLADRMCIDADYCIDSMFLYLDSRLAEELHLIQPCLHAANWYVERSYPGKTGRTSILLCRDEG